MSLWSKVFRQSHFPSLQAIFDIIDRSVIFFRGPQWGTNGEQELIGLGSNPSKSDSWKKPVAAAKIRLRGVWNGASDVEIHYYLVWHISNTLRDLANYLPNSPDFGTLVAFPWCKSPRMFADSILVDHHDELTCDTAAIVPYVQLPWPKAHQFGGSMYSMQKSTMRISLKVNVSEKGTDIAYHGSKGLNWR